MPRIDPRISAAIAILAAALWLGGMIALGAIVAPVVFRVVPAPANADAMTLVFRRFDSLAMACAVAVLVIEALRAVGAEAMTRLDAARLGSALVASGLAIVQGLFLSPAIEALHLAGAVRGVGDLGMELDAKHQLAEMGGKLQALMLVAFIVLHVVTVARRARSSP